MLPIYTTPHHVFNYDEIPPGYYYDAMLNGSAVQRFWHKYKFLEVARKVGEQESVLDLGCGPGSFLSILGKEKEHVSAIGVDIASSQIEFASREIAPAFGDRIKFQVIREKENHLPFEDNSFDVITSIEVIEHIHPYLVFKMLEDAKRVLKPGGRLILTTPNYRSFWPIIEFALEKMSPVKYHAQHINKFTPNSLVKFLEAIGFSVKNLETIFLGAPFTAGVSWGFAQALHNLEKKSHLRLGSLLLAECQVVEF